MFWSLNLLFGDVPVAVYFRELKQTTTATGSSPNTFNARGRLMITCLSHNGQNSIQKTTFKVLLSCKQVCQLSLKNRLAEARGKRTIIVGKMQRVQFIQNTILTNELNKITLGNLILRSLQRRETT